MWFKGCHLCNLLMQSDNRSCQNLGFSNHQFKWVCVYSSPSFPAHLLKQPRCNSLTPCAASNSLTPPTHFLLTPFSFRLYLLSYPPKFLNYYHDCYFANASNSPVKAQAPFQPLQEYKYSQPHFNLCRSTIAADISMTGKVNDDHSRLGPT